MITIKKLFAIVLLTGLIAFNQQLFGQGDLIVHLTPIAKNQKVDIHLANLKGQRTEVSLRDINGKVWVTDYAWNDNGYAKTFNMQEMPDGLYYWRIKNKTDQSFQPFYFDKYRMEMLTGLEELEANSHLVKMSSSKGEVITRIKVDDNPRKINVQLANLRNEPALIRLTTLGGVKLLEKEITRQVGYHTAINMKGMDRGDYLLSINTPEGLVLQFFSFGRNGIQLHSNYHLDEKLEQLDKSMAAKG